MNERLPHVLLLCFEALILCFYVWCLWLTSCSVFECVLWPVWCISGGLGWAGWVRVAVVVIWDRCVLVYAGVHSMELSRLWTVCIPSLYCGDVVSIATSHCRYPVECLKIRTNPVLWLVFICVWTRWLVVGDVGGLNRGHESIPGVLLSASHGCNPLFFLIYLFICLVLSLCNIQSRPLCRSPLCYRSRRTSLELWPFGWPTLQNCWTSSSRTKISAASRWTRRTCSLTWFRWLSSECFNSVF